MKVSYNKDSNEVIVNNFLGEKVDRKIKLVDGVEVSVKGEDIEITSANIESAGNAAAQIEKGTKVRNKDRRIYQDGIFITEKPGRVFE
jgi:large subunit ribosomal protein L6